jgi:hypothetical protein
MRWLYKLAPEARSFVFGTLVGGAISAVTLLALIMWTVAK